mgnify:CR=1 FL=1
MVWHNKKGTISTEKQTSPIIMQELKKKIDFNKMYFRNPDSL